MNSCIINRQIVDTIEIMFLVTKFHTFLVFTSTILFLSTISPRKSVYITSMFVAVFEFSSFVYFVKSIKYQNEFIGGHFKWTGDP